MWPNCTQIPSSGELWWSWSWQSYDDDYWYFRIMEALWMFLKCKIAQKKSWLHAYANYVMFSMSNTISTSIIVILLRYAASLFLEHHLPWAEGTNYQYRFSYFGLCNFICSQFYPIVNFLLTSVYHDDVFQDNTTESTLQDFTTTTHLVWLTGELLTAIQWGLKCGWFSWFSR